MASFLDLAIALIELTVKPIAVGGVIYLLIRKTIRRAEGTMLLRTLIDVGKLWLSASLLAYFPVGFFVAKGELDIVMAGVVGGGILISVITSLAVALESAKRIDELEAKQKKG